MYAAEILGWTSLAMDPREVHERGVERLAAINEERMVLAAELGYRRSGHRHRGTHRLWRQHRRHPGAARGTRRGPGPSQLGGRALLLRPAALGQLRGAACGGVPRGRRADGVLLPADRRRHAGRHLLHQLLRPAGPGAAPRRERHLPRGEPRAPLPAGAATGDAGAAAAAPVRLHVGGRRVRGRVGPVLRAPGRRDGPVPRRLGAARHAREPGAARRAPRRPIPGSTRSAGPARRPSPPCGTADRPRPTR